MASRIKTQYIKIKMQLLNRGFGRKHPHDKDGNGPHWGMRKLMWKFMVVCIIVLFVVNVSYIQLYNAATQKKITDELLQDDPQQLRGFLIKNEGCRIPNMDPFDPTILSYIFNESLPTCDNVPALYRANRTSIFLDRSVLALPAYQLLNNTNGTMTCCYTPFWRKISANNEPGQLVTYSLQCLPVGNSARIKDEFIQVTCQIDNLQFYKDYFSFVPLKEYCQPSAMDALPQAPLNVLVVGLDGVSRVNLHRQMPNTVKYLHDLSAVELLGYNKVGDSTFPNVVPILTGQYLDHVLETCFMEYEWMDTCPFVWKLYKKLGFVTSYGEDCPWTLRHKDRAFRQQPTDYMWGVFNREADTVIGTYRGAADTNPCIGSRYAYKMFLNYIDDFVETMHQARRRYFAFYWGASLTHDYVNMPKLGDEDYKNLFEKLHYSGRLENTALFFISDHGMRYGEIRQTYLGHLEERLPFVFVILPSWFRKKFPVSYKNLRRNVRRLTSPFDLHETLVHLANFSERNDNDWLAVHQKRGYSLFSNIPLTRTCNDAGIPLHWCTCQQSFKIECNNSVVQEVAVAIVHHMNDQLRTYVQCAELTLKGILDARMMSHDDDILTKDVSFKDYTVTVQTEPGHGIFESTVRHHIGVSNSSYEITGTISRINLYGNQSACVSDFRMKLYCFCVSLPDVLSENPS